MFGEFFQVYIVASAGQPHKGNHRSLLRQSNTLSPAGYSDGGPHTLRRHHLTDSGHTLWVEVASTKDYLHTSGPCGTPRVVIRGKILPCAYVAGVLRPLPGAARGSGICLQRWLSSEGGSCDLTDAGRPNSSGPSGSNVCHAPLSSQSVCSTPGRAWCAHSANHGPRDVEIIGCKRLRPEAANFNCPCTHLFLFGGRQVEAAIHLTLLLSKNTTSTNITAIT